MDRDKSIAESYVRVRASNAKMLKHVALYFRTSKTEYSLYKPAGEVIKPLRLQEERYPEFYVKLADKQNAAIEAQKIFNKRLKQNIASGNVKEIRENLIGIATETLEEPRSGTLKESAKAVTSMISSFTNQADVLFQIANIAYSDYTTALHSVNVMTLMLGFSLHAGFDWKKTQIYGLAALLHDVGKTKIPNDILNAPRKLTDEEFKVMKSHTTLGANILDENKISEKKIYQAALEHHEKLDGSGYPRGIKNVSTIGQLIGIIDIYEALTNDDRPYRHAMLPEKAIHIIESDVNKGKFIKEFLDMFKESLRDNKQLT